jgi:hypothetical protein
VLQTGDSKLITQSRSQSGLEAATRLHEVGIASNRVSRYGTVNMFLGLVLTARQSMEDVPTGSSLSNKGIHGRDIDWA